MKWTFFITAVFLFSCADAPEGNTNETDETEKENPISRDFFFGPWTHLTTVIIEGQDTSINPHNAQVFYDFKRNGDAIITGYSGTNYWNVDSLAKTLTIRARNPEGTVNEMAYDVSIVNVNQFVIRRSNQGKNFIYYFNRNWE